MGKLVLPIAESMLMYEVYPPGVICVDHEMDVWVRHCLDASVKEQQTM
jgi:hypothetical protein